MEAGAHAQASVFSEQDVRTVGREHMKQLHQMLSVSPPGHPLDLRGPSANFRPNTCPHLCPGASLHPNPPHPPPTAGRKRGKFTPLGVAHPVTDGNGGRDTAPPSPSWWDSSEVLNCMASQRDCAPGAPSEELALESLSRGLLLGEPEGRQEPQQGAVGKSQGGKAGYGSQLCV